MAKTLVLLLLAIPAVLAPVAAADPVDRVVLVSVDGLRADLLEDLIAHDVSGDFASFRRLVDEGATTFNARADYFNTTTLPNHTCMVTGRPVLRPAGQPATVHHGYTSNVDPGPDDTLHNMGNPDLDYIAGVFDVAHDHGLSTALYASKSKFVIFDQSWDADSGAPDLTVPDDGPDKIDTYLEASTGSPANASNMHAALLADLTASPADLTFVHYRDPDSAGHASGWGSTPWIQAVRSVDGYLGDILALIDAGKLGGRVALVVTADHGGTGTGHDDATDARIYTIPFMVWGTGVAPGTDLYALNPETRLDPGPGRPDYDAAVQPVRNGGAGNLALALLGLPAIPGSSINGNQDLAVGSPLSAVAAVPGPPVELTLYPNPANPATTIDFTLAGSAPVRLEVFDVRGRRVAALADRPFAAGAHAVPFRGSSLSSGVYLVRLEIPGATLTRKLMLLR